MFFAGVLAGLASRFTALRWGGGSARGCCREQADAWNDRRPVPDGARRSHRCFSASLTKVQFRWESTSGTKASAGVYGGLERTRRWEPLKLERYSSK